MVEKKVWKVLYKKPPKNSTRVYTVHVVGDIMEDAMELVRNEESPEGLYFLSITEGEIPHVLVHDNV